MFVGTNKGVRKVWLDVYEDGGEKRNAATFQIDELPALIDALSKVNH